MGNSKGEFSPKLWKQVNLSELSQQVLEYPDRFQSCPLE